MDKLQEYLHRTINSFSDDPADSDYQRGYLSAMVELGQELIPGFKVPDDIIDQLRQ